MTWGALQRAAAGFSGQTAGFSRQISGELKFAAAR